jgi:hypothetical protein
MIGNDEVDISVEDLSSSEIDIGGIESLNKRLERIHMNFNV